MTLIPIKDFINRVITNKERVQFSHVDPYGHLNASRYAEFIVNHRTAAADEQLSMSTYEMMRSLGVGFVFSRIDVRFHRPSFLGEILEIASWVESLHDSGFKLKVVVSGAENRKVRATSTVEMRTVDVSSGKAVHCPEALPTRAGSDVLQKCPSENEYLATLTNVPGEF